MLPFLIDPVRASLSDRLRVVAPSRVVAMACAPMAALNFDMWNIIPIQMTFWMTVFGAQMVFLVLGHSFERQWDVTEYKESYISVGFFVFALQARSASRE